MDADGKSFPFAAGTPEANLVVGMKWLLGTFSQGWNRARQQRGHVFQGRSKSVPVNGEEAGAYYFRIVADYIHLNPARTGMACGSGGKLIDYKWSSLGAYAKGRGPDWMVMERVLRAFESGAAVVFGWLEARAAEDGWKINEEAQVALRRGRYLEEESCKDKLLAMLDRARIGEMQRKAKTGVASDHWNGEAERLVNEAGKV